MNIYIPKKTRFSEYNSIFHRLQHKDVFKLIKKHNLYDVINKSIVPLIQLDSEQAISMLLERNKIPADVVVSQLQNHEEYLYLVGFLSICLDLTNSENT